MGCRSGRAAAKCVGTVGQPAGDAEVHELLEAVLHVQAHAAERGHERLDVEGLVRLRVQKADESGTERRLHQRAKACSAESGSGRAVAAARCAEKLMSFTESIPLCVSAQQAGRDSAVSEERC